MTTTDPRTAKEPAAPNELALPGSGTLNGQCTPGTHRPGAVEGHTSPQANGRTTPMAPAPAGSTDTRTANDGSASMAWALSGTSTLNGHTARDTHTETAVEGSASPQAHRIAAPMAAPPAGNTDTRTAITSSATTAAMLSGADVLNGHLAGDTQVDTAVEDRTSPQASGDSATRLTAPAGNTAAPPAKHQATARPAALEGRETSQDQTRSDVHTRSVLADDIPGRHTMRDAQAAGAAGEQDPPAARAAAAPMGMSLLADPLLALAADVLDDLEKVRIANENRLRQLTRVGLDADGLERGFGLDESHPDVARLAALVGMLAEAEHKAALNLQRVMRAHPLGPWVKATVGIGEKQGARLIAAIGDPYWNTLHDRPRTVSELWAYCGYHVVLASQSAADSQRTSAGGELNGSGPGQGGHGTQGTPAGVAPKRQRGQKANWSATAKMRAFLAAESCMKQRESPYRAVYDATRVKYAEAVHDGECARCGPRNNPATPGSPLSEGHKHARALRAVAKEILRDLWRESRALHIR